MAGSFSAHAMHRLAAGIRARDVDRPTCEIAFLSARRVDMIVVRFRTTAVAGRRRVVATAATAGTPRPEESKWAGRFHFMAGRAYYDGALRRRRARFEEAYRLTSIRRALASGSPRADGPS
jgi:hypothetical protein